MFFQSFKVDISLNLVEVKYLIDWLINALIKAPCPNTKSSPALLLYGVPGSKMFVCIWSRCLQRKKLK